MVTLELGKADTGRQRALLETLVKRITFDGNKMLASISLHLHDDVARALGLPTPTGLPICGSKVLRGRSSR